MSKPTKKFYLFESQGYLLYAPSSDLLTADPDSVKEGDTGVSFKYGAKTLSGEVHFISGKSSSDARFLQRQTFECFIRSGSM